MRLILQLVIATIAVVSNAGATTLLTLDTPDQVGHPGDTLQFFGSLTNTGPDTVFLNSSDLNFTNAASFTTDDLFAVNVPVSIDPGQTVNGIEFFDITLSNPFTDPFDVYSGTYTLLGGSDPNAMDVLTAANFSVSAEAGSTVPEPTLVIPVCAALALLSLRRRSSNSPR
jgi:hypothetical protein